MTVKRQCPICGKTTTQEITTDVFTRYNSYTMCGGNIQDYIGDQSPFIRDFLRMGICEDCYEKMYNVPTKKHEKAFGEMLGICPNCDHRIYQKEMDKGHCPSCGEEIFYENGEVTMDWVCADGSIKRMSARQIADEFNKHNQQNTNFEEIPDIDVIDEELPFN